MRLSPCILLAALLLIFQAGNSYAESATWDSNPISGDWNTPDNWTPETVPNGAADVATFGPSSVTGVSMTALTEISGIIFSADADAFTITATPASHPLTISGAGITNDSGKLQSFAADTDGTSDVAIQFTNFASAGSLVQFTNNIDPTGTNISSTIFADGSTAANTAFVNNGGITEFKDTATAGAATITNNGAAIAGFPGGATIFADTSTASDSVITGNGGTVAGAAGGSIQFLNTAAAAKSILIANQGSGGGSGASIMFEADSSGDSTRIKVLGNGNLDVSAHNGPGLTVGSIQGSGLIFLGASNLMVGSDNSSTTFSGRIQDGGAGGGIDGSLTKIGNGKLTLTGANTYSGGTVITAGTLFVSNRRGSGTGTGLVQLNSGKLGGNGKIAGSLIVGTGSGPGATLTPGTTTRVPATLTIQQLIMFKGDGIYRFGYRGKNPNADKVVAESVTINSSAQFVFDSIDTTKVPVGTVFTAIDNTTRIPIAGAFGNLLDGSTVTVGNNKFQISYEGGDGNDLTLTVVP